MTGEEHGRVGQVVAELPGGDQRAFCLQMF
jgi:hypothetical protein